MLKIWGRANSVNVQKVLWCCAELGIAFERVDAGMQFGRNHDADYLAMNPTGRIPTIEDGDFKLWESHAILRYLALRFAPQDPIYPAGPRERASVERWLDWTLSTLQPAERPLFWGYVRTAPADRDAEALKAAADTAAGLWAILDHHLEGRTYLEAGCFTLADLVLGTYARRWFGLSGLTRPSMPSLERWYSDLESRGGFQSVVAGPLS